MLLGLRPGWLMQTLQPALLRYQRPGEILFNALTNLCQYYKTMPNKEIVTECFAWVFLGLLVVSAIWDTYCILSGQEESTISELMYSLSVRLPVFPFFIGVLVGHLFWTRRK